MRPFLINSPLQRKGSVGFTLIEILVVMGLIAVLAAIVLVAINPARQFAQSRNATRFSDINAILNAISQNVADNRGNFNCPTALPATLTVIKKTGGVDLRSCLVSNYISELPVDSSNGTAYDSATGTYDTGYDIMQDANTKRITIKASNAELGQTISLTR